MTKYLKQKPPPTDSVGVFHKLVSKYYVFGDMLVIELVTHVRSFLDPHYLTH